MGRGKERCGAMSRRLALSCSASFTIQDSLGDLSLLELGKLAVVAGKYVQAQACTVPEPPSSHSPLLTRMSPPTAHEA